MNWVAVFGLFLLGTWAGDGRAQDATPVFRSGVQLVELTVAVRDKSGKPAVGLQASDFVLLEDGKERRIDVFAVPVTPESRADASSRLPEGIYSNAPEINRDSRGIVIVLLDSVNTCVGNQMQAKSQVAKFLRNLPPDQRMALYSVGSTFRVIHDFTSDPEILIERLRQTNTVSGDVAPAANAGADLLGGSDATGDPGGVFAFSDPQLTEWVNQGQTLGTQFQYAMRIQTSVRTLRAIAESVERLPGKKTLIWLSGGFPQLIRQPGAGGGLAQFNVSGELRKAMEAANRAGLAIYTVDSRGLDPGGNFGPNICDGMNPANTMGNQGVLLDVAKETGGRPFVNMNDLGWAMRTALDDVDAAYTLGFYIAEDRRDGKPHRLEVKLRRPELAASHRQNYVLPKEDRDAKPFDRLQEAASSPVNDAGLLFLAALHPAQDGSAKAMLQLVVQPDQVQFSETNGQSVAAMRLVLVQRKADGTALPGISDTIRVSLSPEQRQQVQESGLVLTREVERMADATQLRVVLEDQAYSLTGSLTIPLKR